MAIGLAKGAVVSLVLLTATVVGGKRTLKWLRSLKLNNIDADTLLKKYRKADKQAQQRVEEANKELTKAQQTYGRVLAMSKESFSNYPNRYPVGFIRYNHFKAQQIAKKRLDKATDHLKRVEQSRDETKQLLAQAEEVHRLSKQGDKGLADAQRKLIKIDQERPLNINRKAWVAIGAGLTGLVTTAVSKIDLLNWGHGERQLGRYWYQVFYKSGDFNHSEQIDDLLPVIRAVASTFNYRVNDRALELL